MRTSSSSSAACLLDSSGISVRDPGQLHRRCCGPRGAQTQAGQPGPKAVCGTGWPPAGSGGREALTPIPRKSFPSCRPGHSAKNTRGPWGRLLQRPGGGGGGGRGRRERGWGRPRAGGAGAPPSPSPSPILLPRPKELPPGGIGARARERKGVVYETKGAGRRESRSGEPGVPVKGRAPSGSPLHPPLSPQELENSLKRAGARPPVGGR